MRIDNRIGIAPLFALSFAIACSDSETVLGRGGTGGSDSGSDTGGSSTGTGGTSGGTGGRVSGTGGRTAGGASGSSGNGGSSGNAGSSAGGVSGDGGPVGDGSAAGGTAGAGGGAAGGAGGRAAGGAGGRAAGGAGGRGTGGRPVGTACERLGDCCATVPLAVRPQCTAYATANMQPQCGALLGFFCAGTDAGTPPPPQDAADSCSALDACCPTAGPQQSQCEQTVAAGNPGLCNLILGILCP